MINTFLSRYGLKGIKIGGPLLTIFEAVGQVVFRNSQDLFNLLDAQGLDRATGTVLDRHAESEDTTRLPATFATGNVDITDTSFAKISSTVYLGAAAPTIGSSFIIVTDASAFAPAGTLYIGRGQTNVEGPLTYNKVGNQLNVVPPLAKYHNTNEEVIMSQGGIRTIPAGTIVKTSQDNGNNTSRYSTRFNTIIEDGEVLVEDVGIICTTAGVSGNAAAGTIENFDAAPFTGATVTNVVSVVNGQPIENDDTLRERIRNLRASRSKATDLALITAATGVTSPDENKTVMGASIIANQDSPSVLYIDDGTGYEELDYGVNYESMINPAIGGEQYAQLTTGLPIAAAYLISSMSAPYALVSGSQLNVLVGGVLSSVSFATTQFKSIGNATAYEIVSVINSNPTLLFSARTAESGTKVVIFAKTSVNEDLEIVAPTGVNANTYIGFPLGVHYTSRLYQDGQLLYKDGQSAIISSNPQVSWSLFPATVSLTVAVDGTAAVIYTITDVDFTNNNTGYNSVSHTNSLQSWATVLTAKIPGVTTTAVGDVLVMTSNLGANVRSQIVVSISVPGEVAAQSLINLGMFEASTSIGKGSDYSLNRNTGQIKLTVPLASGDTLTAGSSYTRAFAESAAFVAGIVNPAGETIWVAVDGSPAIIPHNITATTNIDIANVMGDTWIITLVGTTFPTDLAVDDWIVMSDPAFAIQRAARIIEITAVDQIKVVGPNFVVDNLYMSANGLAFVRTSSFIHKIVLDAAPVTLAACAITINSQILGATASVYQNTYIRITTNTYGTEGGILVAGSTTGVMGFALGEVRSNTESHLAAVESGNTQSGTPNLANNPVLVQAQLGPDGIQFPVPTSTYALDGGETLEFCSAGNNLYRNYPIYATGANFCGLNDVIAGNDDWAAGDFALSTHAFGIAPNDTLRLIFDNESLSKSLSIPMFRSIKGAAALGYGSSIDVVDEATSTQLQDVFGPTFDLTNFGLFMHSRVVSHYACAANTQILWRYAQLGAAETSLSVRYVNPTAPNQAISIVKDTFNPWNKDLTDIQIRLPSLNEVPIANLTNTTPFYAYAGAPAGGGNGQYWYYQYAKFKVVAGAANMVRTGGVVLVTPNLLSIAELGIKIGDTVYITGGGDVNYPVGAKIVSAATPTSFSYIEGVGNAPACVVDMWATLSGLTDPDFSGIMAGMVMYVDPDVFPAAQAYDTGAIRIFATTTNADGVFAFQVARRASGYDSGVAMTKPYIIRSTDNFKVYPIDGVLANDMVSWINTNASNLVTAKSLDTGLGWLTIATNDEYNQGITNYTGASLTATNDYWTMFDGLNYISSCDLSIDSITLNKPIAADLALYGDWDNEIMQLVPQSTQNIVDYLNNPTVSNLSGLGQIARANQNGKVQLVTNELGSLGAIQVIGGTANSAAATVVGSATVNGTYTPSGMAKVTVPTSQIGGFTPRNWAKLQASQKVRKNIDLSGSIIDIAFDNANGLYKVTSSVAIRTGLSGALFTSWNVLTHSPFAEVSIGGGGFPGGCGAWIRPTFSGITYAFGNSGWKREVANISDSVHWFYDTGAVRKIELLDSFEVMVYDSMMPGDTFVVNSNILGTANVGRWIVADVDDDNNFWVYGAMTPVSGITITSNYAPTISVEEAEPYFMYKRIHSIVPNVDPDYTDIVFWDLQMFEKVSSSAGYSVVAQDKLAFPLDLIGGLDAYSYAGGLLGEVTRVIYGDSSNTSLYPGVVAAGANVDISGPLTKRVQVVLNARLKTNISETEVKNNIKNIVAATINSTPIGTSIAISDIVAAANSIQGVTAITVSSPLYNNVNDLITVQANEKPRVFDIDQDVVVNLLGN
jgi:uncharacterized phage protein gp47/JayE